MQGLSLKEIAAEIQLLDPSVNQPDDPVFQTAVVLLAAAFSVGPNTERLVAFTGYAESFVTAISLRMRQHGLWRDDSVDGDHWFDGDYWRPPCFWTDCLIAQGLLTFRHRESGDRVYRALKPN